MPSRNSLYDELEKLVEQRSEINRRLTEIRAQLDSPEPVRKRRKKRDKLLPESATSVVKLIQAAGEAIGRQEIAEKLGITPAAATKRIERAVELGVVERVGYSKYQCAPAAQAALEQ